METWAPLFKDYQEFQDGISGVLSQMLCPSRLESRGKSVAWKAVQSPNPWLLPLTPTVLDFKKGTITAVVLSCLMLNDND